MKKEKQWENFRLCFLPSITAAAAFHPGSGLPSTRLPMTYPQLLRASSGFHNCTSVHAFLLLMWAVVCQLVRNQKPPLGNFHNPMRFHSSDDPIFQPKKLRLREAMESAQCHRLTAGQEFIPKGLDSNHYDILPASQTPAWTVHTPNCVLSFHTEPLSLSEIWVPSSALLPWLSYVIGDIALFM